MKIFPWILVIALTVAAAWFYSEDQQKSAELAALKAKVEKLKASSTEEPTASSAAGSIDQNEVERLRKENEEVYRLRAEVTQLRKEKQNNLNTQRAGLTQVVETQPVVEAAQEPPPPPAEPDDEATRLKNEHAMQCVNNMKVVEDAKSKWAEANGKNGGDAVAATDISPYLPNLTMPTCPDNGTYSLNEIGIPVSCTVEGHSLLP